MSPSCDSRENRELAEEVKFLVAPETAARIRLWARANLASDPNGTGQDGDQYRITSLYFDTADFAVFRRHESYGRSKYRIRRYGDSAQVFLERKLKTHGLVTKRRSLVPAEELTRLGHDTLDESWRGRWYLRRLRLRNLRPVCQIAYDRTARVTMTEHGPVRLTIDSGLEALPADRIAFQPASGTPISSDRLIVEIKFRAVLPPLLRALIQEFALAPVAVSKYRLSVVQLGLAPGNLLDAPEESSKTQVYA